MRRGLFQAVAVLVVSWALWAWGAEPPPQVVVGTIIALPPLGGEAVDAPVGFGLRVDEAGPTGSGWRQGDTAEVAAAAGLLYGTALGDQVRVTLSKPMPAEPRRTALEIFRLGRGEFVNPGKGATIDIGSPNAKLLVKLLVPLGTDCHQQTAELLQRLAKSEPDRLRVQIFDYHRPEGVAETNRERLKCATVLVNNRYEFMIGTGAQKRKVSFMHKPNTAESLYSSEDVVVVVQQEIARLYPPPKPAGGDRSASGQTQAAR
jgi:hypothetical protein